MIYILILCIVVLRPVADATEDNHNTNLAAFYRDLRDYGILCLMLLISMFADSYWVFRVAYFVFFWRVALHSPLYGHVREGKRWYYLGGKKYDMFMKPILYKWRKNVYKLYILAFLAFPIVFRVYFEVYFIEIAIPFLGYTSIIFVIFVLFLAINNFKQ